MIDIMGIAYSSYEFQNLHNKWRNPMVKVDRTTRRIPFTLHTLLVDEHPELLDFVFVFLKHSDITTRLYEKIVSKYAIA